MFIYSSKCCRSAEHLLCSILLLVASDFRLHLPVLMYCGDKLLLGVSSGCLNRWSLSTSRRLLFKLNYIMWCMKNLKLHEISVFIAYSPENRVNRETQSDGCQLMWGDNKGVMLRLMFHLPSFKLRTKTWNKVTHFFLLPLLHRSVLLWPSTLTKLCQSEHSIALMNRWIILFIHDSPCQLFSVYYIFTLSPKIFMELFSMLEVMYLCLFRVSAGS